MSTVSAKLTELANAIRSKSGATGKLSLDGMIAAVNGISTGGSSTPTYTMWGSQALSPYDIDVLDLAGTYPCSGIYAWFYDYENDRWGKTLVDSIVVDQQGFITINSKSLSTYNQYNPVEDWWTDENEHYATNYRLLLLDIIEPITVSAELYTLFSRILDNGLVDYSGYDVGYNVGYAVGSSLSGDIEALGALCDWNVVVDSISIPTVTVVNYHPSYWLVCDLYYGDGSYVDWAIPPDDSDSINCSEIDEQYGIQASGGVIIENVRWMANEP